MVWSWLFKLIPVVQPRIRRLAQQVIPPRGQRSKVFACQGAERV